MIKGFAYLDRIRSKEEFDKLVDLAKKDSHGVYSPTHTVKKNDELVGWFSIGGSVPVVFAWLSTKNILPRESLTLVNSVENHVALSGATHVAFPVPKDSPFHGIMEHMGYKNAGEYTFFLKPL